MSTRVLWDIESRALVKRPRGRSPSGLFSNRPFAFKTFVSTWQVSPLSAFQYHEHILLNAFLWQILLAGRTKRDHQHFVWQLHCQEKDCQMKLACFKELSRKSYSSPMKKKNTIPSAYNKSVCILCIRRFSYDTNANVHVLNLDMQIAFVAIVGHI